MATTHFFDDCTFIDGTTPSNPPYQFPATGVTYQSNQLRFRTDAVAYSATDSNTYVAAAVGYTGDFHAIYDLTIPSVIEEAYAYHQLTNDTVNYYEVFFQLNGTTIEIRKSSVSQTSYSHGGLSANDVLHFRVWKVGARVRLRFWKNADPEPGTWQIDWTDGVSPVLNQTGQPHSLSYQNGGAGNSRDWFLDNILYQDTFDAPAEFYPGKIIRGQSVRSSVR